MFKLHKKLIGEEPMVYRKGSFNPLDPVGLLNKPSKSSISAVASKAVKAADTGPSAADMQERVDAELDYKSKSKAYDKDYGDYVKKRDTSNELRSRKGMSDLIQSDAPGGVSFKSKFTPESTDYSRQQYTGNDTAGYKKATTTLATKRAAWENSDSIEPSKMARVTNKKGFKKKVITKQNASSMLNDEENNLLGG